MIGIGQIDADSRATTSLLGQSTHCFLYLSFFLNLFKEALKEKYIHEEQSLRRKVVHFN